MTTRDIPPAIPIRRRNRLGTVLIGLAVLAGIWILPPQSTHAAPTAASCGARSDGSVVGQCAATFTLRDARGRIVSLAGYRGHPVLLNFWGVGCAYCAAELPDLQRFAATFTRAGGVILGVNSWGEPRELIAGYARRYRVGWPLLPDQPGNVASLYGVRGTPTNVFIDARGVIRAVTIGPLTLAQFSQHARGI